MTPRLALIAAALILAAGAAEARSSGGFGSGRSSLTTGQITTHGTIIGQRVVVTDSTGARSLVIAPVPTQQALQNQFFSPAAGGVVSNTGQAFFVPGTSTATPFNNTGFVGAVVPVATVDGRAFGTGTAFSGGTLLDSGWGGWGYHAPVVVNLPSGPVIVPAAQAAAPPAPPAKTQVVRIGATAADSRVLTVEKGVLFLQGR